MQPGQRSFFFATMSRPALGLSQFPIQWVPGALSLGVKQWGRETGHLPQSSAKVKNVWSYTSTPPCIFMALCFVKYRIHIFRVRVDFLRNYEINPIDFSGLFPW
jgi:hypothetical protein